MGIEFLELADVMEIHQSQILEFGGDPGVRSFELLESAIAMPKATYADVYLHSTIYEMAAAYLFHLAKNHPFVDGNKRVAAATTSVFLRINGLELDTPKGVLADFVLSLASGEKDKTDAAVFLKQYTKPRGE